MRRDRVGGEHPAAEAMDGRDPGSLALPRCARDVAGLLEVAALRGRVGALDQPTPDPLSQLGGGPLGERERQDLLGTQAVLGDGVAVALDQHAGLPGARSGLGEDVTIPARDRVTLRGGGGEDLGRPLRIGLGVEEGELPRRGAGHDPLPPFPLPPPSSEPTARSSRQIGWY